MFLCHRKVRNIGLLGPPVCPLSFLSLSFHSVKTVHEDAVSTPGVCSQEQRGSLSSGRILPKKEDGSLFILWKRAIEEKDFVGVGSRLAYLGRTVFGRLPGGKQVSVGVVAGSCFWVGAGSLDEKGFALVVLCLGWNCPFSP